jgi:hypothetical protein
METLLHDPSDHVTPFPLGFVKDLAEVSSDSEERGRWWRGDCSGGEKWWWSRGAVAWVVDWHRW